MPTSWRAQILITEIRRSYFSRSRYSSNFYRPIRSKHFWGMLMDDHEKYSAKTPRRRLHSESYKKLCREVLQRDVWKCQFCCSFEDLQIHHQKFRSHGGDDSEQNLITLCANCHSRVHQGGG